MNVVINMEFEILKYSKLIYSKLYLELVYGKGFIGRHDIGNDCYSLKNTLYSSIFYTCSIWDISIRQMIIKCNTKYRFVVNIH